MRASKAISSLAALLLMMTGMTAAAQQPGVADKAGAGFASARTSQLDHDRGFGVPAAELRRGGNA